MAARVPTDKEVVERFRDDAVARDILQYLSNRKVVAVEQLKQQVSSSLRRHHVRDTLSALYNRNLIEWIDGEATACRLTLAGKHLHQSLNGESNTPP